MSRIKESAKLADINRERYRNFDAIADRIEVLMGYDKQKDAIIAAQDITIDNLIQEKLELEQKLAEKNKLVKFENRIISLKDSLNKEFS